MDGMKILSGVRMGKESRRGGGMKSGESVVQRSRIICYSYFLASCSDGAW